MESIGLMAQHCNKSGKIVYSWFTFSMNLEGQEILFTSVIYHVFMRCYNNKMNLEWSRSKLITLNRSRLRWVHKPCFASWLFCTLLWQLFQTVRSWYHLSVCLMLRVYTLDLQDSSISNTSVMANAVVLVHHLLWHPVLTCLWWDVKTRMHAQARETI